MYTSSGIDFLEIPMELWLNKGGSLEEGIDNGILLLIENDIDLLYFSFCLRVQGCLGIGCCSGMLYGKMRQCL